MNNKKSIKVLALAALAIVQLYIPAKMIWDREDVLTSGMEFKFRSAPVDPGDPFRGKYISLQFAVSSFGIGKDTTWQSGDPVYVHLDTDAGGYARVAAVSHEPPAKVDFVEATVSYVIDREEGNRMWIAYPFDTFYMEETRAPEAENIYLESLSDSTKVTYAIVRVKDGTAVLQDVMIDGVSISEMVKQSLRERH